MRLITAKYLRLSDASKPKGPDGFFPETTIAPGEYLLEEIPNPSAKPGHLALDHWCGTWLVIAGTLKGSARIAFEHNYIHRRDKSVTVIL